MNTFMTLIVAAPVVEQMRQLASSWEGGEGMWVTALTDGGVEPTHYISSGYISEGRAQFMPYDEYVAQADEEGNVSYSVTNHAGDVQCLVDLVNTDNPDAGLTIDAVNALMPYIDASTQQPREAMQRMGLSIWSDQSALP